MNPTVLVAAFAHESNTFVPDPVDRDDFKNFREFFGDEVATELRGTNTVTGGVIDAAEDLDIELIQTVDAFAMPGGPLKRETYEFYADKIVSSVQAQEDIDGVILPLHGAMVAEHIEDGEGELIERVRKIVGSSVPIVVTLDLHGNVTDRMVTESDALVAYETYPHLDQAATGHRGMEILDRIIREEVDPTMHFERPPTLIFQPKAYTKEGPMTEVMSRARQYETRDEVLKVNILPGFYHADISEMGVTVPVLTDGDEELAREISREMAEMIWEMREDFVADYPSPQEAVAQAKNVIGESDPDDGPVVMADFGSNPGGGGAANGTTVLREMLNQGLENAGWAIMHDPEAVDACIEAGVRERVTVSIGGKTDDKHGAPIEGVDGYVKAITDGRYVNTGTSHMGEGVQNDIGRTVLFQCGENDTVNVVLAERRAAAFDAEIWRHVGIQPERLDAICIPSLIAFLGDYEPMSTEIILIDTPGLSAVNPERFEYDRIPRPLYPLDEMPPDSYPEQDE